MTDAQTLTLALCGTWHRRYGLARCPAHGDRRPSLTIADAPDGRLLLHCKAGCSFPAVLDTLRERGFLNPYHRPQPPSPAEVAQRKAKDQAEAVKREKQALTCWREALPIRGTIAETYLRKRGIACELPDTLRFHPDCWHPTAQRTPAMVALIEGLPRLALHRTYLRPDGTAKADTAPEQGDAGDDGWRRRAIH